MCSAPPAAPPLDPSSPCPTSATPALSAAASHSRANLRSSSCVCRRVLGRCAVIIQNLPSPPAAPDLATSLTGASSGAPSSESASKMSASGGSGARLAAGSGSKSIARMGDASASQRRSLSPALRGASAAPAPPPPPAAAGT